MVPSNILLVLKKKEKQQQQQQQQQLHSLELITSQRPDHFVVSAHRRCSSKGQKEHRETGWRDQAGGLSAAPETSRDSDPIPTGHNQPLLTLCSSAEERMLGPPQKSYYAEMWLLCHH